MHSLYYYCQQMFEYIQVLIGHKNCFLCHQSSAALVCEFCQKDISLPIFPSPAHNLLDYERVHKHLLPPSYVSLHALGEYKGIIAGLVSKLKFSGQVLAAKVLSDFFVRYLKDALILKQSIPDALVPIPLSKLRYAQREFNQAHELSVHLSKGFDIPICQALTRHKHTKQQSSLDKEQRLLNIQNAFDVSTSMPHNSIALVDDVITTGATINAACEAIQATHPDIEIHVWCMAVSVKN